MSSPGEAGQPRLCFLYYASRWSPAHSKVTSMSTCSRVSVCFVCDGPLREHAGANMRRPGSRTGSCSLEILGSHARIHRVIGFRQSASTLLDACFVWNGCCTQPTSTTRVRRFAPRNRLEGVAQSDALKKPTQSPQRCCAGDVARYVVGSV